jgi:hypothetical protein
MALLLLPHEKGFQEILATPPPSPQNSNFVVRKGGLMMESVDSNQLSEYLQGGEYEERMEEIDDDGLLWLPDALEIEWDD